MQPFSTAGFRLHAHVTAFKDSRQRGGLDRGHSEVAQLIQVSQLGFRQNVQRGKAVTIYSRGNDCSQMARILADLR